MHASMKYSTSRPGHGPFGSGGAWELVVPEPPHELSAAAAIPTAISARTARVQRLGKVARDPTSRPDLCRMTNADKRYWQRCAPTTDSVRRLPIGHGEEI